MSYFENGSLSFFSEPSNLKKWKIKKFSKWHISEVIALEVNIFWSCISKWRFFLDNFLIYR